MTGRPCSTAQVTRRPRTCCSIRSTSQSSAYCRIGEEPMKRAHLDRDPDLLRDLDDRRDVVPRPCAPRSSGRIFSFAPRRSPAASRVTSRRRAARRPAARCRPSRSRAVHQVEDPDLLVDRGTLDRGRLEPVAQRLVVELDGPAAWDASSAGAVPVVDEVGVRRVQGVFFRGKFSRFGEAVEGSPGAPIEKSAPMKKRELGRAGEGPKGRRRKRRAARRPGSGPGRAPAESVSRTVSSPQARRTPTRARIAGVTA